MRWTLKRQRAGLIWVLFIGTALIILRYSCSQYDSDNGSSNIASPILSVPDKGVCVIENINDFKYIYPRTLSTGGACPNIEVYPFAFVHFKDVVIDPGKAKQSKGGESLSEVRGQAIEDENLNPKPGYFTPKCNNSRTLLEVFHNSFSNEFRQILDAILIQTERLEYDDIEGRLTIGIQRTDYANLYHSMTEWYNVFMIAYILRRLINCNVNILFLDGHPYSYLDETWTVLFGRVTRAAYLKKRILFNSLVVSLQGSRSLMNDHKQYILPGLEQFSHFCLKQYGLNRQPTKNCKKLNILFILRRNYVAHSRNPTGQISRKIKNENELLKTITEKLKDHNVSGVQMDRHSMYEQLTIITRTNVLIGMHGAGLSHVLFLPLGSAVIELFPKHTDTSNRHFRAMARWRNLEYVSWQNVMDWNEYSDGSTYIPPRILAHLLRQIIKKICL